MLTARQKQLFDFISECLIADGVAPSLGEICAQLDLRRRSTANRHVTALVERGFVRRTGKWSRGIEIVHGQFFKFNDQTKKLEPYP